MVLELSLTPVIVTVATNLDVIYQMYPHVWS